MFSFIRECDCISEWVRYFRPFGNAFGCRSEEDILVLTSMWLGVNVGEKFSSVGAYGWILKWMRYLYPFLTYVWTSK